MKIKLIVSPSGRQGELRISVLRDGGAVEDVSPFTEQEAHTWCLGAQAALEAAGVECEVESVGPALQPLREGMKAKLVAVQLETCHHNTDGTAWYAYYDGEPELVFETDEAMTAWQEEVEAAAKKDRAPLGLTFEDAGQDEAPNALSEHAGLRRYLVALAG